MSLPSRVSDLVPFDLLLSVARLGSLGLAATEHGISQPAASTRIRRLERQLGISLIERSPRGSRLTPDGRLVAEWAQAATDAAAALDAGIASLRERSDAVLRVTASMTVAEYLLPGWLTALRARDPKTTVNLTAGNSAEVAAAVLNGDADLGFVEGPDLPSGLASHHVGSDLLTVVVPPAHRWARRRSGITAAELAATPLVARERGSGTRGYLEEALHAQAGLERVPPVAELSSTTAIKSAVAAGIGPAVLSSLAVAPEITAGTLRAVRVSGLDLTRRLLAVWAVGRQLTGPAADLRAIAARGVTRAGRADAHSHRLWVRTSLPSKRQSIYPGETLSAAGAWAFAARDSITYRQTRSRLTFVANLCQTAGARMTDTSWMGPGAEDGRSAEIDLRTDLPHPARIYDYLLGGKDNFAADRAAAEEALRANPDGRISCQENRAFLQRAVHYLAAEAGIRQFLDIGAGLPTSRNVHEVAQAVAPDARIVYVDNDPIVLAHARALLTSTPAGKAAYVDADLRDLDRILNAPQLRDSLDLNQPVALLLIAIMHFIPDQDGPYEIVKALLDALPAGSYLAMSHLSGDFDPQAWDGVAKVYAERGMVMRVRSKAEIERFFDGLDLVEPGVRPSARWRPAGGQVSPPSDAAVACYGGLARKG